MRRWHCAEYVFAPNFSVSCENLRSLLQVPVRDHLISLIAKASIYTVRQCRVLIWCLRFWKRRQLILKRFIEPWLASATWYNPDYIFLLLFDWLQWIYQIHACKANNASLPEAQKGDVSRCLELLPKRFPETRVQNVAAEIATLF